MKKLVIIVGLMFASFAIYAEGETTTDLEKASQKEAQPKSDEPEKPSGLYYLQLTVGPNYSVNENVRFGPFGNSLRYGGTLTWGIKLTPYWNLDFSLGYNKNVMMFAEDLTTYYYFHSWDIFVNASLNLTTCFGGVNPLRKSELYLYAGVGGAFTTHIYDTPSSTPSSKDITYAFRGGLHYTYAFNQHWALALNAGFSLFGDKFNGIDFDFPLDGRANLEIGVRYTWGNSYHKKASNL